MAPTTMKAWQLAAYNEDPSTAIDALTLNEDAPIPASDTTLEDTQVLVKVGYASVNPVDWKVLTGGLHGFFPITTFPYTPGSEIAGTIEQVGSKVTKWKVGDVVCAFIRAGSNNGAFAQYAAVNADSCAKVPLGINMKDVVGLPLAGATSYEALFTGEGRAITGEPLGNAAAGSKVLILGAAGGVGMLAVQMAKARQCFVAATASTSPMSNDKTSTKVDFVKSLGADVVIDYTKEDWGEMLAGKEYDIIYDCIGKQEDFGEKAPKVLKKGGVFVSITNHTSKSTDHVRFASFMTKGSGKELEVLLTMVEKKEVKVVIDSEYTFKETKEALKHSLGGRSVGKIIIKM